MNFKRLIQLFISIVLIAILIYWIDFENFINSVKHANYFYIFIAFIIVTFSRLLMAYKWNILLKVKGINLSLFEVTKIYYISNFLGLYLPPTIGGDIVRAYYITKKKYQISDIISSIVVERIIGLLVLLLFAVIGGVFFYLFFGDFRFDIKNILILFIVIFFIIFTFFYVSLDKNISNKILNRCDKFISDTIAGRLIHKLKKMYVSYLLYKNAKIALFIFFLLTSLEVFSYILRSYVVAQALNVEIPFIYLFSFVPIIMALIRLPISLNGFGINEGGFVFFLSLIGISKTTGFSVGLIDHLIVLIAILPGGIFYLFDQGFYNKIKK